MNTITTHDEPITNTLTNAEQQTPPTEQKVKAKVQVQQLGKHINLKSAKLKLEALYFCQQFKDALYVSLPRGHVFIFDYGMVLFWSVSAKKQEELVTQITKCIVPLNKLIDTESWCYQLTSSSSVSIRDDVISIPNKDVLTLLSVSHALAQSSMLEYFEVIAKKTIIEHDRLTSSLATKGIIPLTRKALSKERGRLFRIKSDILLHFNLLDIPEFFWQYPEQEGTYKVLSTYLELGQRVELLNVKLTTISELLDMLATEQHHKHAAFLEWIIIILIAVDIAVYFIGD